MVPGSIYGHWSLSEQQRRDLFAEAELRGLVRHATSGSETEPGPTLRMQFASTCFRLLGGLAQAFQPKPVAPRGFRDGLW